MKLPLDSADYLGDRLSFITGLRESMWRESRLVEVSEYGFESAYSVGLDSAFAQN